METKPPPPRLIRKRSTLRVWNGKEYEVQSVVEDAPADEATTPPQETAPADDEEVGFGEWRPEESDDMPPPRKPS